MRRQGIHVALLLALLLAIGACGKKTEPTAPIAFVPADTPYVMANLEGMPEPVIERWQQQMQGVWPLLSRIYDPIIDDAGSKDEGVARVLRAMLDEVRERDTQEKWRQIGFSAHARVAIYGVGLLPVARIELADPAAFRAMVARIEQNGGARLSVARLGGQEFWTLDSKAVQALIAIVDQHLVLALVPAQADEGLKRRVLGLDRPQRSLADTGALAGFNKARGYLPYGSGWVDMRRIVALYADDPNAAAIASAAATAPPRLAATCRAEFDALAAKAPILAFGYTALDPQRWTVQARLDLAPALAKALAALPGALPAPSAAGLLDIGFALPILRGRDFLVAQMDAAAKAPFACPELAPLNAELAKARSQLDRMIPPPLADLVGARVSVSRFAWPQGSEIPDVSGSVLVGSANPAFLTNLAQVTIPQLAQLKLAPDGQPVAIPAAALPGAPANLELHAAMRANVLGLSFGPGQAASLATAVAAAPAAPGVLFEMNLSGEVYRLLADAMDRFIAQIPAEQRGQIEGSRELYAMYARWFKRVGMSVAFTGDGVQFIEDIEFNP